MRVLRPSSSSLSPWLFVALALLLGCPDSGVVTGDDDDTTGDDDTAGDDDDTADDDDSVDDDDTTPGDEDGDGWTVDDGDCDDTDPDVHPGADDPACDGVDTDCVQGATWLVPGDHATIQAAVDAAVDDDEICVSAGTYAENLDFAGKAVHVRGVDGPLATVIDGGGAGSTVRFASGEGRRAVLDGFTVTGGSARQGGGIHVRSASPTLTSLYVHGNMADTGGVPGTAEGAGIYLGDSQAVLTDVVVHDNSIMSGTGDAVGGGIAMDGASPTLIRAVVSWNVAMGLEGACLGGGVSMVASDPTFEGLAVTGNVTFCSGSARGGGLYAEQSSPQLRQASVVGNAAQSGSSRGGGVYADGGSPVLAGAVIAGNVAADGGGIFDAGATFSVAYSAWWDNTPDDVTGMSDPTGSDGNLAADPGFLDTSADDALAWDLHLAAGSPLVDAGDPTAVDPDGSPADIGMYGGTTADGWDRDGDGHPEWWQPGPYDPAGYPAQGWDCDDLDPAITPLVGC